MGGAALVIKDPIQDSHRQMQSCLQPRALQIRSHMAHRTGRPAGRLVCLSRSRGCVALARSWHLAGRVAPGQGLSSMLLPATREQACAS
jgi:hypothetical protein